MYRANKTAINTRTSNELMSIAAALSRNSAGSAKVPTICAMGRVSACSSSGGRYQSDASCCTRWDYLELGGSEANQDDDQHLSEGGQKVDDGIAGLFSHHPANGRPSANQGGRAWGRECGIHGQAASSKAHVGHSAFNLWTGIGSFRTPLQNVIRTQGANTLIASLSLSHLSSRLLAHSRVPRRRSLVASPPRYLSQLQACATLGFPTSLSMTHGPNACS